jgi:mannitol-1-phosphate 5-dehydrogenase
VEHSRIENRKSHFPTVVQFGAGNIGRGFMGQIYTEAGYEVVFVDVSVELVSGLNERRAYPLRLAGPDRFETLTIQPVRAVDGRDLPAVAEEIARCAFACTAVGVPALPHVAPALAAGIRERGGSLDVVLCENQLRCSDLLRGYLLQHLDEEELRDVGLVESVVSRMVPLVPEADRDRDPLLAVAEDYPKLPVDRSAFVGQIPPVPAFQPVENFDAYVERKLFVHNMGHATAAYLGYARGCRTIHEAMAVPEVRAAVTAAMAEAGEALARKHGFDRDELLRHRQDLLRRFENAALNDTVLRVGRDPVRKLRPEDRLVGAALTCLDWGVEPEAIVRGIVGALRFDPGEDPGAQTVRSVLREHGVGQALGQFTGQRPDSELGRRVIAGWEQG